MSGAGKSSALKVLEDLGYEVVDNLPVTLIGGLVRGVEDDAGQDRPLALCADVRTRAFDIERSSTRREELLLSGDELARVYTMRRMLAHLMDTPGYDITSATAAVLQRMRTTKDNYEFLETLTKDM